MFGCLEKWLIFSFLLFFFQFSKSLMNESHLINEHLHLGKQEPQSVSLGLAEYFLMEVPKMQGPS